MKVNFASYWMVILLIPAFAVQAHSSEKSETASKCLRYLESGDTDQAREIANVIKDWKHLFAYQLIKDAEICLSESLNERWKYFPTKSRFLSGPHIEDEENFISGARQRKEDREILRCKRGKIYSEMIILEDIIEDMSKLSTSQVQASTYQTCSSLYETDSAKALLSEVCNSSFEHFGLPGSPIRDAMLQVSETHSVLVDEAIKITATLNEDRKVVFDFDYSACSDGG